MPIKSKILTTRKGNRFTLNDRISDDKIIDRTIGSGRTVDDIAIKIEKCVYVSKEKAEELITDLVESIKRKDENKGKSLAKDKYHELFRKAVQNIYDSDEGYLVYSYTIDSDKIYIAKEKVISVESS